ncbi:MAG: DNA repair protein RecO [Chloroflexota bacterium]
MARAKSFRAEGIILSRSDIGEADRLLTMFTRDFGKLKAVAKGVRKPQSKQTGHVELFMRTKFLIARGKTFGIATQSEMIEAFTPLREDLIKTTYAAYAVELLDKFTGEEDKNITLFELIHDTLSRFAYEDNPMLVARYYELRLLSLTGFQPQLFRCVDSQEALDEEDQYFSADLGGILKPSHLRADRRAKPISAGALKVLRYLQSRPWDTVKNLQLRRLLHSELEEIMHYYIAFHLERKLRSIDFLKRLRIEATLYKDDQD